MVLNTWLDALNFNIALADGVDVGNEGEDEECKKEHDIIISA